MKSLADQLPAEIARQIHPDWRKNEAAYSNQRDRLLAQYRGQWVAFADGTVIAAAATPLDVFLAIQQGLPRQKSRCSRADVGGTPARQGRGCRNGIPAYRQHCHACL